MSTKPDQLQTYETLLRLAWGERNGTGIQRVRNFVKKLRAKLGDDAAHPAWIRNERGVGYRMPGPDER